MKKTHQALILGLAFIALQGCVISVTEDGYESGIHHHDDADREDRNRAYISDIDIGAAVDRVKQALGTPDFNEIVVDEDDVYTILYYRTQRKHSDGMTTKDECTPLLFLEESLVGVGEIALSRI
ncbi:MAG: DUF3192 domain-containing protein [Pseudomonadota bacterium]